MHYKSTLQTDARAEHAAEWERQRREQIEYDRRAQARREKQRPIIERENELNRAFQVAHRAEADLLSELNAHHVRITDGRNRIRDLQFCLIQTEGGDTITTGCPVCLGKRCNPAELKQHIADTEANITTEEKTQAVKVKPLAKLQADLRAARQALLDFQHKMPSLLNAC